jgi:hypothetical protein
LTIPTWYDEYLYFRFSAQSDGVLDRDDEQWYEDASVYT